jgi:hypothetical protein
MDSSSLLDADEKTDAASTPITQQVCDNNVRVLTACFFLINVGYSGFQTLSAPLYEPSKVGSVAVGTQVMFFTLSCLGPNTLVAQRFGNKRSMNGAFLVMICYCGANVAAASLGPESPLQYVVLIPFACLVGMSNAVMWTAQGLFVTHNATYSARISGVSQDTACARYFGLFNTFSALTGLVAFIAQAASGITPTLLFAGFAILAVLGFTLSLWLTELPPLPADTSDADYDDVDAFKPPASTTDTSTGSAVTSGSQRSAVTSGSQRFPTFDPTTRPLSAARPVSIASAAPSLFSHITDAIHMWYDRRFRLLIPLLCYVGLSDGFEDGVFAAIVVDRNVGTGNIGYVMAAYSLASSAGAKLCSMLPPSVPRIAVFFACWTLKASVMVLLLLVDITAGGKQWTVLYISVVLMGLARSVLDVKIQSMLSQEFPGPSTPPAYANYFFWRLSITSGVYFSIADASSDSLSDYLLATLVLIVLGE